MAIPGTAATIRRAFSPIHKAAYKTGTKASANRRVTGKTDRFDSISDHSSGQKRSSKANDLQRRQIRDPTCEWNSGKILVCYHRPATKSSGMDMRISMDCRMHRLRNVNTNFKLDESYLQDKSCCGMAQVQNRQT